MRLSDVGLQVDGEIRWIRQANTEEPRLSVDMSLPHWRFAFGAAYEALKRLIENFNFSEELSGHARYVGGPDPTELIAIIDGFLTERKSLPDGNISELERLRTTLEQKIVPAYRTGQWMASQRWVKSSPKERAELAELDADRVTSEAWNNMPDNMSSSEANWFVEGFCRADAGEWFTYVQATGEST